jgi:hypothetical protein
VSALSMRCSAVTRITLDMQWCTKPGIARSLSKTPAYLVDRWTRNQAFECLNDGNCRDDCHDTVARGSRLLCYFLRPFMGVVMMRFMLTRASNSSNQDGKSWGC